MRGERGSSKADTLVKVTLVFFISLLSFSVGTFVGKQVSDSEHRKLALEGEFKGEGREVASEESGEDEHGEKGEGDAGRISEKEVASLTEEFVNKESEAAGHGEEHAEAAHEAEGKDGYKTYGRKVASVEKHEKSEKGEHVEKAEEAPSHEAAHESHEAATEKHEAHEKPEKHAKVSKGEKARPSDATHHAAEKLAEGVAPSDGEHEKPRPKPGLPPVESATVGKYTVQVASYPEESDAKTRAEELKGKGYQSFYLPANVKGKTWYRVLLGMFPTAKMAEEYKARIIKEGGTKAALVQKIVQ